MTHRRRPLPPDTRLDWRDPAMQVIRHYRMSDGTVLSTVDPDYEHRYREMLMATSTTPTYHSDPTYHLRKTKPNAR